MTKSLHDQWQDLCAESKLADERENEITKQVDKCFADAFSGKGNNPTRNLLECQTIAIAQADEVRARMREFVEKNA